MDPKLSIAAAGAALALFAMGSQPCPPPGISIRILDLVWQDFLTRHAGRALTDKERVDWDRRLECGDLPPGYLLNPDGDVVGPSGIMKF